MGFWLFSSSIWGLGLLLLFFTGFNLLEATLPSLVSKLALGAIRGTATTSQFSGAFVGGLLGGWVHARFGETSVFLLGAGFILAWLLLAGSMEVPAKTDAISPDGR